jgi:hypothetical protein
LAVIFPPRSLLAWLEKDLIYGSIGQPGSKADGLFRPIPQMLCLLSFLCCSRDWQPPTCATFCHKAERQGNMLPAKGKPNHKNKSSGGNKVFPLPEELG